MPSTTVLLENIERTTQATLDALNAWDYDALASHHTDDWVFQRLPHSLNLPPLDNEQYRELWVNFLTPAFKNFKVRRRASQAINICPTKTRLALTSRRGN